MQVGGTFEYNTQNKTYKWSRPQSASRVFGYF